MEPESSIRKTVSNDFRKAYGSVSVEAETERGASVLFDWAGPGVYAGGASVEELNGFMLELSLRLLAIASTDSTTAKACYCTYLAAV
jgi:hypothetical protein